MVFLESLKSVESVKGKKMDNDLYKMSMLQASRHNKTNKTPTKYKLILRSPQYFNKLFLDAFSERLSDYKRCYIHRLEIQGCPKVGGGLSYYTSSTPDFNPLRNVDFQYDVVDGKFSLEYSGTWEDTIMHEVPLMSIISEEYYRIYDPLPLNNYGDTVKEKWKNCLVPVIEMGTRRRISLFHQDEAIRALMSIGKIKGTSNVQFSEMYKLPCFGSVAHEWYMALGNERALYDWLDCKFDRNIALPDTFTTVEFLKIFNKELATKYDGVRQDSGDPCWFADTILDHYNKLGIDPKTKTLIFSDNLHCADVNFLYGKYKDLINCEFGVGSNISCIKTNRLNMTIKMIEFDGKPVHKKSDDPAKST